MMNNLGNILAIIMALLVLFDRFTQKVTKADLLELKNEILNIVSINYPSSDKFNSLSEMFKDMKEKVDVIYDIILKGRN